jgi:hypothetical protein
MISVDDQLLLAKSEDYLKYSVCSLNNTIVAEFSMEINTEKVR